MNQSTGTGNLATAPASLSLEAYSNAALANPQAIPAAHVLSCEVDYGSLGTTRAVTLVLLADPGWSTFTHLVRGRLTSEQGTGYVFAGIVEQCVKADDERWNVQLSGLHRLFDRDLAPNTVALLPTAAPIAGVRTFGGSPTREALTDTVGAVWGRVAERNPGAEWGVGGDLYAAGGLPLATATYDVGTPGRPALGLIARGLSVPDYATKAVYAEGGQLFTLDRPGGAPAFVPRNAVVSGSTTVTSYGSAWPGLSASTGSFNLTGTGPGSGGFAQSVCNPSVPGDTPFVRYTDGNVSLSVTITSFTGTPDIAWAATSGGASVGADSKGITKVGLFTVAWPGTFEQLRAATEFNIQVFGLGNGTNVQGSFGGATGSLTHEVKSAAAIAPNGFDVPFAVGPTYEFRIPNTWAFGPLQVTGLPGGSAKAAGTKVRWIASECSTTVLTAAKLYGNRAEYEPRRFFL